jgi:hypothetical protein
LSSSTDLLQTPTLSIQGYLRLISATHNSANKVQRKAFYSS